MNEEKYRKTRLISIVSKPIKVMVVVVVVIVIVVVKKMEGPNKFGPKKFLSKKL